MDDNRDINNIESDPLAGQLSLESILAEFGSDSNNPEEHSPGEAMFEEDSQTIALEALSGTIASSGFWSRDNFKSGSAPAARGGSRKSSSVKPPSERLFSRARSRADADDLPPPAEGDGVPEIPVAYEPLSAPAPEAFNADGMHTENYDDFLSDEYAQEPHSGQYDYYGGGLTYDPDAQDEKKSSFFSRIKDSLPELLLQIMEPAPPVAAIDEPAMDVQAEPEGTAVSDFSAEAGHTSFSSAAEFLDDFEPEAAQEAGEESVSEPEPAADNISFGEYREGDEYSATDFSSNQSVAEDVRKKYAASDRKSSINPIIAVIAIIVAMIQSREKVAKSTNTPPPPPEEYVPELPPAKAAKHYHSQVGLFTRHGKIAALVCIVLIYISYAHDIGLPLPSAFSNVRLASGICLLMLLCVIMLGLNVFTNGMTALFRRRPCAETLVSLSCIFSALDAMYIMLASGETAQYVPYCAVSAVSMTFAILGNRLVCTGFHAGFKTAAKVPFPQAATIESEISDKGPVLMRTRHDAEGFVRSSEESDCGDSAYSVAAPFFIAASLILALLVSAGRRNLTDFPHVLSAITAACASFSALIAFPLPFSTISRRLAQSGAAIAGWRGANEIGKSRGIVVTDADIFPASTITIEKTQILAAMSPAKVISYAGSLLAASGASVAMAFTDLIQRNGYNLQRIDDFSPHEGGGLTATIRGERVYVGSSGFMQLLSIKIPRQYIAKDAIYIAISEQLMGIFNIGYTPMSTVQSSLVTLLGSRGSPYFAIRDFNITPQLINEKFKLPAESFEFPSFEDRYRLSASVQDSNEPAAALFTKENLNSIVEAFLGGRRLYFSARLCVLLSLFSSVTGMLLMFFLCWSGAFDSASVGNVMSFMLLWLTPIFIVSLGLRR